MDITMDGMGSNATEPPTAGNSHNVTSPPATKTDFDVTAIEEMTMPSMDLQMPSWKTPWAYLIEFVLTASPVHPAGAYSRPPPAADPGYDITALDDMALPSISLLAPPTWARPI